MLYIITYTKETVSGTQLATEAVQGTFTDAMYKAHSLTNCSYVIHSITEETTGYHLSYDRPPRQGHRVTKQARRYVALSAIDRNVSHRPSYEVWCVGGAGVSKQDVADQAHADILISSRSGVEAEALLRNLFVPTPSTATRSYKAAWHDWEATQVAEAEATEARHQRYAEITYRAATQKED